MGSQFKLHLKLIAGRPRCLRKVLDGMAVRRCGRLRLAQLAEHRRRRYGRDAGCLDARCSIRKDRPVHCAGAVDVHIFEPVSATGCSRGPINPGKGSARVLGQCSAH